ncbi:hypothetical protein OUZ56_004401 [Daphnia magna]|uniref:Uncharacterized protein n=1 Tax=Daphnia magna TaxID=35525 RepID=A0ABQ9YPN8_9CRUS|nr:hypothetical protein OUZ56_004401 [Daphnia magna]
MRLQQQRPGGQPGRRIACKKKEKVLLSTSSAMINRPTGFAGKLTTRNFENVVLINAQLLAPTFRLIGLELCQIIHSAYTLFSYDND